MAITTKYVMDDAKLLEENYNYYNTFLYTPKLGETVNALLSASTNGEMAFRVLNFVKNENRRLSPVYPEGSQNSVGESGLVIEGTNDGEFSRMSNVKGSCLFVGSLDSLSVIKRVGIKSFRHLKALCQKLGVDLRQFDRVLTSEAFADYPALRTFFFCLNQWRVDTGLVTLDDEVIESAFNEALNAELEVGTTR